MKISMVKLVIALSILMVAALGKAYAEEAQQQSELSKESEPFVNVNMVLELDGIEASVQDIQGSFASISDSLAMIASSDSLTAEQQQLLSDTVENLNRLITVSRDSVKALPVAKQVVQQNSQDFFDEVKFNLMLVIALIALVLIAVIGCIYWLVLKPMQTTVVQATANISTMAVAIRTTAQALESSTEKQQQIWQEIESNK